MTSIELTSAITVLANAISVNLTADEIALISCILVQLGDTLATIGTAKSINENSRTA